MNLSGPFSFDDVGSDDDRVYIEVAGLGSVCLIMSPDGLTIDVWSLQVIDSPIAAISIDNSSFYETT
jgi:hypothetical protein